MVVSCCTALCRLLAKARDWLAWAASAAKQRAPLKRMREVLHAGLRLGVEVPQVDELRLEIRRREWEELAKKVGTPQPSAGLAMLMAESAAIEGSIAMSESHVGISH